MDARQAEKYRQRLYSRVPLLGGWLRTKAAGELARDGSPAAARLLAEALTRSDDREVRAIALDALRGTADQRCIDVISKVWAATRHASLAELLAGLGRVAVAPVQLRVLTALKLKQFDIITLGGADMTEALVSACNDVDSTIARRARQCLAELKSAELIDAVCALWAQTRSLLLAEAVLKGGYVARRPVSARVLTALKAGRPEAVSDGGEDVIKPLVEACEDREADIARNALLALRHLKDPDAKEALCRMLIEGDNAIAHEVALAAGYAPRNASERALFYFLTDQWEKYESLDFDHRLLRVVYEAADNRLRARLTEQARRAGRVEYVEIAVGGRHGLRTDEITDEEWSAAFSLLDKSGRWEELWRLAREAPGVWGARFLVRLEEAQWHPASEEERIIFAELLELARGCGGEEPALMRMTQSRLTLRGHMGAVLSLAFSPDGHSLASAGDDYTARIWSLSGAREVKVLTDHNGSVKCLALGSGGDLLATGGADKTIRLWSLPDGRPLRILEGHNSPVTCLAISSSGAMLASGGMNKTVRLWQLPHGSLMKSLNGHRGAVCSVAITPDGCVVASAGEDRVVHLWSASDGRIINRLEGHTGSIWCMALTHDGKKLATGSADSSVRVWSMPDGKLLDELRGHSEWVTGLAFSPDDRILASGSLDATVCLWRTSDGQLVTTLKGHSLSVSCLAISPNGRFLASGSDDHTVRIWAGGLNQLPISRATIEDMEWAQEALSGEELKESERAWLEFFIARARLKRRYDIELDEAPMHIQIGEFDIELEG